MAPKIEAHVLVYSLMFGLGTLGAVSFSRAYAKPQAELDAELRAKYPDLIKKSQDQKIHMQAFFDKMKDRNNNTLDADFAAILKGGNGDVKRTQVYDSQTAEPEAVVVVENTAAEKKETKASVVESTKKAPEILASKTK